MKTARGITGFVLSLALLSLPILVIWKYQAISDWWRLRDYSPPAEIAALATTTTMTDTAEHIFYVNHPTLEKERESFRQECPQSEQTIVLGCYHSDQKGIAIYDVTDPRLNGVEEVTAAHEMLHAAYDRLSNDERSKIDGQLMSYYQTQLKDERILETIEGYKKTEPTELVNEMHSIFGTEVPTLPSELESYYNRYFSDRAAVIRFSDQYEQEFAGRLDKIEAYDAQLAELKGRIETLEHSLEEQANEIESDRRRLDSLRAAGRIDEYNAGVASFNAKVNSYNQQVARLRREIETYNRLVTERNAIAVELRGLNEALDTRLVPQAVQ